ncbi:endonuclease/exonuclease/phosphatase family protein [Bacillus sp. PS06]|uniref:endonuclease/exonuclease/phosphatase family protein n=1 Tax=Bacillus sp. PS06 TaxID=2764176 RepID=UPI001783661A|nr:endonuclease/exonuclease/phosphatase family protein [Bacillus sp. PS06]MBD8069916.1 endonuclease/exonuclease/phosphatase family protein [Bacillus sp. PS06]
MKLLTLNCHSWIEENQLGKIKILAEEIKAKSYDVITLQEVNQSIDAESVDGLIKKDNFALVLLEELQKLGVTDYQMTWDYSHIGYDVYEEGVALLTKHPIEEKHSFFVSHSEDTENYKTRKISGITIRFQHELLTFYSCHTGWWEDEEEPFKEQFDRLYQVAAKDGTFFLMGDFNNAAHIRGEGYDYVLSKGLYDTYHLAKKTDDGTTVAGKIAGWDKNKQGLRIDYIFSSIPVEVKESCVIFNGKNKPVISDHFGVEVTLG